MNDALTRNAERRRELLALVADLTEAELALVLHGEWTVAAKLAHIAFWDRFALGVLERWAAHDDFKMEVSDWYDDVLNDAVLVESLALPRMQAASLAADAVSVLDARLEGLTAAEAARLEVDAADPGTDANWLLHRYRHRGEHLDEIMAVVDRARQARA